jgi:hypothetical protein
MFIHYKHLLYFSYMCRRHVHHHQGEICASLLKTIYRYLATDCGFNIVVTSYIIQSTTLHMGTAYGGTVVKVLRYKSEGRWFDSRWYHWNFSLT